MKKLLILIMLLVSVVSGQNLLQKADYGIRSTNLFTQSPYGINEFDLTYVNGNWYLFYCTYVYTSGQTFLKVASSVKGLDTATIISLTSIGVSGQPVVPSVFYDSSESTYKWKLNVADLSDGNKNKLYISNNPTTAWIQDTAYKFGSTYGDVSLRKHNGKWYIGAEDVANFNTVPQMNIFRSDSIHGTWTDLGQIIPISQRQKWTAGHYDAQINFINNRLYATFTAVDRVDTSLTHICSGVEIDTNTFRIVGKPKILQYPDSSWHTDSTTRKRIFDPKIVNDSSNIPFMYYSKQSWGSPAGWGRNSFAAAIKEKSITTNFRVLTIRKNTCKYISNSFLYDYDLSELCSDSDFVNNTTSSKNILIYDPSTSSKCKLKVFLNKTSKILYVRWIGKSDSLEKKFHLCFDKSIDNTELLSEDSTLLANFEVFNDTVKNSISGTVANGVNGLTFTKGILGQSALNTSNGNNSAYFNNFTSLNGRGTYTIEMLFTFVEQNGGRMIMFNGGAVGGFWINGAPGTLTYNPFSGSNYPAYEARQNFSYVNSPNYYVITFNNGTLTFYVNGKKSVYVGGTPPVGTTFPTVTNTPIYVMGSNSISMIGYTHLTRFYSDTKDSNWVKSRYNVLSGSSIGISSTTQPPTTGSSRWGNFLRNFGYGRGR